MSEGGRGHQRGAPTIVEGVTLEGRQRTRQTGGRLSNMGWLHSEADPKHHGGETEPTHERRLLSRLPLYSKELGAVQQQTLQAGPSVAK